MVDDNLLETDRKRYADDVTVQELVRLRVENDKQRDAIERLREALQFYAVKQNYAIPAPNEERGYRRATKIEADAGEIARAALQQKESE